MAFDAAIVAIAAYGAYNSYEQTQEVKKQTKAPTPALPSVADTTALDDQRRKRLASSSGRDQTILAPPGALLGLPGPSAGGPPPKTQLGA